VKPHTGGGVVSGGGACLVDGSSERNRLLEMAAGNPDDRRQALLADPSLAATPGDGAEFSDVDVERLKEAVRTVRRMRRLDDRDARRPSFGLSGLAAALLLVLVFLSPAEVDRSMESSRTVAREATRITHPGIEAIDLPGARVYELAEEDFDVVLIVDESLEL
jgi:hypothetical protein